MKQIFAIVILLITLVGCKEDQNHVKVYLDDIGDTRFNPQIDRTNFKFCDSANVLHKRAFVRYTNGNAQFEKDLISKYEINPIFESFTGYFIIRFAVNCMDELGRLRWEILDNQFKETSCPKALEDQVISIMRELNHWTHPFYNNTDYDGYTFVVIKFENGNIIPS